MVKSKPVLIILIFLVYLCGIATGYIINHDQTVMKIREEDKALKEYNAQHSPLIFINPCDLINTSDDNYGR